MKIHDVEQNTEEWHQLRLGMPTASEFSKLVSGTGKPSTQIDGYANHLAAEVLAGKPVDTWEGNQWTDRGHELEDEARAEYELMTGFKLQQVGFITDDTGRVGCSPDRVIDLDGPYSDGIMAGVEIKCLKASNHVSAMMYMKTHGRMPPSYRSQVQGQISICGFMWVALFFYHPDLPSTVWYEYPDPEFKEKLKSAIIEVINRRDEIVTTLREEENG